MARTSEPLGKLPLLGEGRGPGEPHTGGPAATSAPGRTWALYSVGYVRGCGAGGR